MTMPKQHADRVDRITNDPERIEKRKRLAGSITVHVSGAPGAVAMSDEAVHAAASAVYGSGFDGSIQKEAWLSDFRKALEAAAPYIQPRETALVECLYRGYKTLGFDTDGDRSGAEMLSRMGLGGGDLDAFISLMDRSFVEHRKDYDEACGVG